MFDPIVCKYLLKVGMSVLCKLKSVHKACTFVLDFVRSYKKTLELYKIFASMCKIFVNTY